MKTFTTKAAALKYAEQQEKWAAGYAAFQKKPPVGLTKRACAYKKQNCLANAKRAREVAASLPS